MKRKVNIGIALSKNFQKVSLDIIEEEIEFECEQEFNAKIRRLYDSLSNEVNMELQKHTLIK